jgi:alpha-beta hydrolase superfamily lysophospholipase
MGDTHLPHVPAVALTERLELVDTARTTPAGGGVPASPARTLETWLWLPERRAPAPLVVFAHGFRGHPRKFTRLLGGWCAAGYAVAAPAFPLASDAAPQPAWDDLASQPHDLAFVADSVLGSHGARLDAGRIAYAGFSMGAIVVLAAAFALGDRRPRAVVAMSGGLGGFDGHAFEAGVPLLVVHATRDPIVPYAFGVEAYERARAPKALLTLDAAVHHEGIEDAPHPASAVVDAATTAFLDWSLRDDATAPARLRTALDAWPSAALAADGI